jgi:hypothetical protein
MLLHVSQVSAYSHVVQWILVRYIYIYISLLDINLDNKYERILIGFTCLGRGVNSKKLFRTSKLDKSYLKLHEVLANSSLINSLNPNFKKPIRLLLCLNF